MIKISTIHYCTTKILTKPAIGLKVQLVIRYNYTMQIIAFYQNLKYDIIDKLNCDI